MSKLIDYIESEKLSKFVEQAKNLLKEKKIAMLDRERVEYASTLFNESIQDDAELNGEYDEEEPNMDVDIEPVGGEDETGDISDADLKALESEVWDDEMENEIQNELNDIDDDQTNMDENFKPGDFVVHKETGRVGKVRSKDDHAAEIHWNDDAHNGYNNFEEHPLKDLKKMKEDLELTFEELEKACENFDQLDELSKNTLVKYIKKSSADVEHQKERAAKARNASQELANAEYANRVQTSSPTKRKYDRNLHSSPLDHPEVTAAVRKHSDAIEKDADRKRNNREFGQYRAFKKLTKEQIEHLDELSKKTLGSYMKKSIDRGEQNAAKYADNQKDYDVKKDTLHSVDHNLDSETKGHLRNALDSLRKSHNIKQSAISKDHFKRIKGQSMAVKKLTKEK